NRFGDGVTMDRAEQQRTQDQQVECTLQHVDWFGLLFSLRYSSRHSTTTSAFFGRMSRGGGRQSELNLFRGPLVRFSVSYFFGLNSGLSIQNKLRPWENCSHAPLSTDGKFVDFNRSRIEVRLDFQAICDRFSAKSRQSK